MFNVLSDTYNSLLFSNKSFSCFQKVVYLLAVYHHFMLKDILMQSTGLFNGVQIYIFIEL